jgi:glutathione S-transferase
MLARTMKLFYTPTSPFVRKVLVAAREVGLDGRIDLETLRPVPTKADATLSAVNPLNKIPALVLDDGSTLFDSRVILEYLDTLHERAPLVPKAGPERFRVLRTQALCDGILDAGILVFYERLNRPKELHWEAWLDGQAEKARQGLDALEREHGSWGADVDLGQIAAAVTLGWLEFRGALGDIRPGRPGLFKWYEHFRTRPSMLATEPK